MGCFDGTCMVTNLPIVDGNPIVLIPLKKNKNKVDFIYTDDMYQLIPAKLTGRYNDSGWIKDHKEEEIKRMNKFISVDKLSKRGEDVFVMIHKDVYDEIQKVSKDHIDLPHSMRCLLDDHGVIKYFDTHATDTEHAEDISEIIKLYWFMYWSGRMICPPCSLGQEHVTETQEIIAKMTLKKAKEITEEHCLEECEDCGEVVDRRKRHKCK